MPIIHALSTKQTIYYIVLVVELLLDEKRHESSSILASLITVLCLIRITQKLLNEEHLQATDLETLDSRVGLDSLDDLYLLNLSDG